MNLKTISSFFKKKSLAVFFHCSFALTENRRFKTRLYKTQTLFSYVSFYLISLPSLSKQSTMNTNYI